MTTIGLVAAQDGFVRLTVLDVSGREVVRLLEGTIPAGERFVTWNGRDKSGRRVSPGVYFYRLETEKGALDRKLVVLP
jgi:flagellar hook assembly protein FlgD